MKKFIAIIFLVGVVQFIKPQTVTPSSLNGADDTPHTVRGIFCFGMGKNFPNTPALTLPYVAGMSSIVTWESMEPREGEFDFSDIDAQLEWAKENGKTINLCLYAGNKSPEWLATKGIPYITWSRKWREDQAKMKQATHGNEKAPVFWDEKYLQYWKKLVAKLADRYAGNPTVGYVSVTGPTPKDLSTGTVIRYDEDWDKVQQAGYTFEKHRAAWTDMLDYFETQFPDKALVVALGPLRPGSADLRLCEAMVDHTVKKKYDNVQFLSVILNDTWFVSSGVAVKLRNIFKDGARQGHAFGYQMVYSAQKMQSFERGENKQIRDFGNTLQLAIDDGASWIEIWHDDIIQPQQRKGAKSAPRDTSKQRSQTQRESPANAQYAADIQNAFRQLTGAKR